jgi:hypothetical protein
VPGAIRWEGHRAPGLRGWSCAAPSGLARLPPGSAPRGAALGACNSAPGHPPAAYATSSRCVRVYYIAFNQKIPNHAALGKRAA